MTTGDGTFDEVWVRAVLGGWNSAALALPVPYVINNPGETTSVAALGEMFRYELLYLGFSKGTLKVQYREFGEKLARPAFYQDVAYDIEKFPATVTFRSMQIEILGADNNQIQYRILSELAQ